MMNGTRYVAAAMMLTAGLTFGGVVEAQKQNADGLINVQVGDITIEDAVDIGVAAAVAATLCDIQVGPVAVLGAAVDATGTKETVCRTDAGPVTLRQNHRR